MGWSARRRWQYRRRRRRCRRGAPTASPTCSFSAAGEGRMTGCTAMSGCSTPQLVRAHSNACAGEVCVSVCAWMGSSAPAASLLVCGLAGALDVFTAVSRDGPPKQSAPVPFRRLWPTGRRRLRCSADANERNSISSARRLHRPADWPCDGLRVAVAIRTGIAAAAVGARNRRRSS